MSDDHVPRLTRRAFLGIIAAAGATACTGAVTIERTPDGTPSRKASPAPARTSAAPTDPASVPPRSARRFEPIDGETHPNAKRVAGRFVQDLTTYDPRAALPGVVRRAARKVDDSFDLDAVVDRAERVFQRRTRSAGTVVYPQLGGLSLGAGADRASVMVVVQQRLRGDGGKSRTVTRAMDVRLVNRGDEWLVEDLADAGGKERSRPEDGLPRVAQRVLDDPRIALPDSARWDIMAGDIDERLLTTMIDLAEVAPYSVCVLKSGHPRNVFATDRISGHTLGRGVDIWKVAGEPVVLQQREKSDAHAFTVAALEDFGVPELGSPWDLDGPPVPGQQRPSFTDAVHADHIHVAFKAA